MKKYVSACIVLCVISLSASRAFAQDFIVIANKDVSKAYLTADELRRIYFGFENKWEANQLIKPSYTDLSSPDFWNVLLTTQSNYLKFWNKRETSGNGIAPVMMSNTESIIDYVANTSGAIGVVEASLSEELQDDIKIVTIGD